MAHNTDRPITWIGLVNPKIERVEKNPGQFTIEIGSSPSALFLTPELAAQWVEALTPLAESYTPEADVEKETANGDTEVHDAG